MPSVRLKSSTPERPDQAESPQTSHTQTGTVSVEIQGQINVGSEPSLHTDLDTSAGTEPSEMSASSQTLGTKDEPALIGEIDLSQITEAGSTVTSSVGGKQSLRGQVVKLAMPSAIMDVTDSRDAEEVNVVDIITHKSVFSKRPEPMLSK